MSTLPDHQKKRDSTYQLLSQRLSFNALIKFFLCALFSLLLLYNYIVPLGALAYNEGIKGHDCWQMVWNLWFVNEAVTSGRNPYATGMIYYPVGTRLTYHTLAAGFFPVTFIVKILSGKSLLYPFYAYRLIILLSFTLSLFFSHQLLRELGFKGWPAVLPAVAYSFSDFFIEHVIHLNQLAGGFFFPLIALCVVRFYKRPKTSTAVLLALVSACAVYFTELVLYVFLCGLLYLLLLCLSSTQRRAFLKKIQQTGVKAISLSVALFALVVAPFIVNAWGVHVIKPGVREAAYYSADLASFFIPLREHTPLYGGLFSSLNARLSEGMGERGSFIGFSLILLSIIALVKIKNWWMRGTACVALSFFVLSLGPALKIFGIETGIPLPYALLMKIPPFDIGRTPVRFALMGIFLLMIVGARGAAWLNDYLQKPWSARTRLIVTSLLLLWTVAEAYSPTERKQAFTPPPQLQRVMQQGPVLNLPLTRNDGYSAMLQIFHHQPIATGFLARYTPEQWKHFAELEKAFNRGSGSFCEHMAALGYRQIVISPDYIVPGAQSLAPLELERCSINVVDLRTADGSLSETVKRPRAFPLYREGTRINFAEAESDPYLWYGWSGREASFRWTDRTSAAIVFTLDAAEQNRMLKIRMGAFLVPEKLTQQKVQIELNGELLQTLSLTDGESKEHPIQLPRELLQKENILIFRLPDAASPASLNLSDDERLLAIRVEWFEINTKGE